MDEIIKWNQIDLGKINLETAFESLGKQQQDALKKSLPELLKLIIEYIDERYKKNQLYNSRVANALIIRELNIHLGGLFLQIKQTVEVERSLQIPIDFIVGIATEYAKEKLGEKYDYSSYV